MALESIQMDVSKRQSDMNVGDEPTQETEGTAARRAPPDMWDKDARRLVRAAMALHGFSYRSLAATLKASGLGDITPASLALRINRGAFSLGFALRLLRAMDVRSLDISHVKLQKPGAKNSSA